jgi:hypothetical protein
MSDVVQVWIQYSTMKKTDKIYCADSQRLDKSSLYDDENKNPLSSQDKGV